MLNEGVTTMKTCYFTASSSHVPLHRFVNGMISDWLDQSSMQQDDKCCPGRNIENVILQYDAAAHTPESLAVVEDGGEIVATMIVTQGKPWLRSAHGELLNVHPDARGGGVGRRLLSFVLSTLAQRGVRRLQLETWLGNESALALFLSTGGLVTGGTPDRTIISDNWLPKVLQSVDDPDLKTDVAGGYFRAHTERADGLLRMRVERERAVSDWVLLQS